MSKDKNLERGDEGNLALEIARKQLAFYDEVLQQHGEAMLCQDCEACLRLGVQAFESIIEADRAYRRSVNSKPEGFDPEEERKQVAMLRDWHSNSQSVKNWAIHFVERGFSVGSLEEFDRCYEEAAAIIDSFNESRADRTMSEPLIALRDEALESHRNGQTSEFV
jgi:hypothetical protein